HGLTLGLPVGAAGARAGGGAREESDGGGGHGDGEHGAGHPAGDHPARVAGPRREVNRARRALCGPPRLGQTRPRADRRVRLAWAGIALLFLAARAPLHRVTWSLPVSNDDAIPLLMARHVLRGEPATILWNQPYNGTLDTYLL